MKQYTISQLLNEYNLFLETLPKEGYKSLGIAIEFLSFLNSKEIEDSQVKLGEKQEIEDRGSYQDQTADYSQDEQDLEWEKDEDGILTRRYKE